VQRPSRSRAASGLRDRGRTLDAESHWLCVTPRSRLLNSSQFRNNQDPPNALTIVTAIITEVPGTELQISDQNAENGISRTGPVREMFGFAGCEPCDASRVPCSEGVGGRWIDLPVTTSSIASVRPHGDDRRQEVRWLLPLAA